MLPVFTAFSVGLLVLISPAAQRIDFPSDLERWFVAEPPARGSDQWLIANHDVEHEWAVSLGDTGPRVKLRGQDVPSPLPSEIRGAAAKEGLAGPHRAQKVNDGWIIGFNSGEFGADLWWFSPDGGRRYKISKDPVLSFIPTTSGLLALAGLAHGGESKGSVVRLYQDKDGRWLREALLDLGHAPEVAVKDVDDSLIVATTGRLLRIVPASKKTEVILGNVFWGGLYPNSMVIAPSGTIFVGMRHGVAKVQKEKMSYKLGWLLPSKKVADEKYVSELK